MSVFAFVASPALALHFHIPTRLVIPIIGTELFNHLFAPLAIRSPRARSCGLHVLADDAPTFAAFALAFPLSQHDRCHISAYTRSITESGLVQVHRRGLDDLWRYTRAAANPLRVAASIVSTALFKRPRHVLSFVIGSRFRKSLGD